jgi:nitrogen fixation NifU-like protein
MLLDQETPLDELRDLYQTTILDHNKSPRNFGAIEHATHQADGHNPVCGDKLTVYVTIESNGDDLIADVSFQGVGCAISTASASLMTEYVKGKTIDEIEKTFSCFHDLVTSNPNEDVEAPALGKLAVFSGVREYPMRVKCATLCWHTLQAAVGNDGEVAKTE